MAKESFAKEEYLVWVNNEIKEKGGQNKNVEVEDAAQDGEVAGLER